MNRFLSKRFTELVPYVPGEQPKQGQFIKLNTNESPFPPSPLAVRMAGEAAEHLELYSDPNCGKLRSAAGEVFGLPPENIVAGNGSDELLNFSFMAFCDEARPAYFPDITYGFYKVFAAQNRVPYKEIPLREDLTLRTKDYSGLKGTLFIANPNAPTGLFISRAEIAALAAEDPGRVIVVDEAYVDFGGESSVPLVKEFDNIFVIQTFSKSRSLAGGRLGLGFGSAELIGAVNTLRFSVNPYNVNAMTQAAGIGALTDAAYTAGNVERIRSGREYLKLELVSLGFEVTDSCANFVFARHPAYKGGFLTAELRRRGILIRHFPVPERIADHIRITVGSRSQTEAVAVALKEIVRGKP